jgi:hypothetical protein
MTSEQEVFQKHITDILSRYCRQNGLGELQLRERDQIGSRLWHIIEGRGLPAPLQAGEVGSPGEMSAAEVLPLVEGILEGIERRPALIDPVRQLVKACFHREFTICRDSFREVSTDGICRRQQLKKALGRVSGSHCVDCPYWTEFSASEHTQFLQAAWRGDADVFVANEQAYLPEDFRALRIWLHHAARR